MDNHQINRYGDIVSDEFVKVHDRLHVISKALKDYVANGKTVEQFEEEYGCKIILDEPSGGIQGVKFHNDSNETMFMLKYDNDV